MTQVNLRGEEQLMIGLDFETFSDVDIRVHGADRYFDSPNFSVLLACVQSPYLGGNMVFDFVADYAKAQLELRNVLHNSAVIAAHNASFERRVCQKLGYLLPDSVFIDSAVVARAVGAGSKLEAAAPQLVNIDKVESGIEGIKLFSIPNDKNGGRPFTHHEIVADSKLFSAWTEFIYYCGIDAKLSAQIAKEYFTKYMLGKELRYEQLTQRMNERGWYVDLALVKQMQQRYESNKLELEESFRKRHDPLGQLNLQSYKQLQVWCAERGVRTKSFDALAVPKLKRQIERKLNDHAFCAKVAANDQKAMQQRNDYIEVLDLLVLKEDLGGSSLSKLQTIIDMTSADGRLRGQYLHVGAGQTYRTSGRGVQLQNLARLAETIGDTWELMMNPYAAGWDNDKLAHNIRQVFEAEHPDGELIVGDFSAVESRGLAYLAGETWKLDAYRNGKDIYKMLATTYQSFGGVKYDDVTKPQRQAGKVGELACGYGAGASAVQGFAEKMGMDMTEAEAGQIVRDWRGANQAIVGFWNNLDAMLHAAMNMTAGSTIPSLGLPLDGGRIELSKINTPDSLLKQHPGAQSLELRVMGPSGQWWLKRIFHGCYFRGNDVCYYKPSELKGGDLWRARMTQPPHAWYKLYGGKIAGILTQSFCRELFMQSMLWLDQEIEDAQFVNVKLIGQFHDEMVVEWEPVSETTVSSISRGNMIDLMSQKMSNAGEWKSFPLVADVKHAHRYIK